MDKGLEDLESELFTISFKYFNRFDNIGCDYLYHYTGESIIFLIDLKGYFLFRMTNSDDLEDKSEGIYIEDIYKKVINGFFNEKYINSCTFEILKNIKPFDKMLNKNKYGYIDKLSKFETYILCLTSDGKSNYMFEHYNNKENCKNICFESFLLNSHYLKIENCDESKEPSFDFGIYKVIYNEDEQISILSNRLKEILNPYLKIKQPTKDENNIISYYVSDLLKCLAFSFKKDCYSNEKEIRIVYRLSMDNVNYSKIVKKDESNNKRYINLKIMKVP